MKIKLFDTTINTDNIKKLWNKPKKLHCGLSKTIKPNYSIEFNDGTFKEITKQEYKLLLKYLESEDN